MRRCELGLISWSSHLLLRCLCLSSCDGLILDSFHCPHTFSWGVSACRHETVWTWTHIMVLTPSLKVSPSVVMRRSDIGLISWSSLSFLLIVYYIIFHKRAFSITTYLLLFLQIRNLLFTSLNYCNGSAKECFSLYLWFCMQFRIRFSCHLS
jgi:hypothetical protein